MLAFVQAAPAVGVLVIWTLILILGGGYTLGELIRLATGKQPLWKRVAFYPLRVIGARIERMVKTIVARASHQFVLASPAIARQLHRTASRIEDMTGEILQLAVATHAALRHLRTTTIPQLIELALAPIRARLDRIAGRVDVLEELNRGVAVTIGNGLRALPWGVPGTYVGNFGQWWNSYLHLWRQFFNNVQPTVQHLVSVEVPQLWKAIEELGGGIPGPGPPNIGPLRKRIEELERWREETVAPILQSLRQRVTALEELLAPAALAVLVLEALRIAAPNLLCRNVTDTTSRVCAQDDDLWASLLAGTMIFAVALNPEQVARAGQAMTGFLGTVIDDTVGR